MLRLEQWSIINTGSPYAGPELVSQRLHGRVYGHPRFDDGEWVTTSPIKAVEDGVVTTYSGSQYELGEVDPQYEVAFPNAHERLNLERSVRHVR